ncbi:dGTP triphosphohydrolase [Limnochorda pilosa]|uniref:Deoxyguanosinetriphosphate triphosphohydrolase-like protein n=1 Tax=Limnochorda pilosa TaxID=1555112 RepID=A0A0K2SLZ1_LIMPI|nr:dNTP triphosphohydrolase [Limnochorda pilosa]BAS27844.1 deoxyguanosinetriphosphate triphosphohydrolase [Limnochorda pilosa]
MESRSTSPAALARLAAPEGPPWTDRLRPVSDDDPREPYHRDRDRIIHAQAFQALQHKTQVYLINEGDFYRTRLTHTLEVAQIARTLARLLGLREPLAEAIALGHDVGHTPFGHAGEQALDAALRATGDGRGWDSNQHSLRVLDELELMYPDGPGLNLTFATRQGVARHATPFDVPVPGFDPHPQPTLEAQVVNLADVVAYAGHDLQDALEAGLLEPERLRLEPQLEPWHVCWELAEQEVEAHELTRGWPSRQVERLLARRARRHFIDRVLREAAAASAGRAGAAGVGSFEEAVELDAPLVALTETTGRQVQELVRFLFNHVYSHPLVVRQNEKERFLVTQLFERILANARIMPAFHFERWERAAQADRPREIAFFLASLTDRGALDLYAELFDPRERAMGHHLT